MRGAIIALCECHDGTPGGSLHFVEYFARKQRRVTRSTFSAELNGAADAVEVGRLITLTYCSIMMPRISSAALRAAEASGKLALEMDLVIDCQSIFDALATETIKTPSESTLVLLLHSLKELLLSHALRRLWWCDARDMVADALNKGSCSRKAIMVAACSGTWSLAHAAKCWQETRHVPIPITMEDE